MILNKAQAEAVRDAICALNNVGMVADIYLPQHDIGDDRVADCAGAPAPRSE